MGPGGPGLGQDGYRQLTAFPLRSTLRLRARYGGTAGLFGIVVRSCS